MRVLVIYFKLGSTKDRNTIDEHLYSFRRYVRSVQFHYFNAANGIPRYLTCVHYDGVILHYTFLAARWSKGFYEKWKPHIRRLKDLKGYKVAIPQDEYAETAELWELFKESQVRTVFTCFSESDALRAYPEEKCGTLNRIPVAPGYVDNEAVRNIGRLCNNEYKRPVDLGYRARKVPYWLGRHGQIKYEIGKVFAERLKGNGLKTDISWDDKDVFIGEEWYKFLCRCKAVLGCEGGASLFDPEGKTRELVERYVSGHPDASFDEVERECFRGLDYNISLFALSPRHFEAAITKTCQVLVEGRYGNIFKPGIHFIEVKKDFSNLDAVIKFLQDDMYCKRIVDNAYKDIVGSGRYTYEVFARSVVEHIAEGSEKKATSCGIDSKMFWFLGRYLWLREALEPILARIFYVWLALKFYKVEAIKMYFRKRRGDHVSNV